MRRISLAIVICTASVLPGSAQNVDIESLSGLQFNFGNPGARSLGMGGAFLGLADDASAAEANPAGLTILRKPEVSIEGREYEEQQIFSTSGTYPDVHRTAFTHFGHRLTFASAVFPFRNFAVAAYFHEPLRNQGAGDVVPVLNKLSGAVITDVPNFFLPKNGSGPVSEADCEAIRQRTNDPFSCVEYTTIPFISALMVQQQTFGLAAAYKIGNVSFGATLRKQNFNEAAFTFRPETANSLASISVQATSDITQSDQNAKEVSRVTFAGGMKWSIKDNISIGAVYKKGARYPTPSFAATADTQYEFVKFADTTFHIPDIYGVGVSLRPVQVLTINADAVRVTYSSLTDHFVSDNADVRALRNPFRSNDVTEVHLGAEYFLATKIPFAVRAGVWRDPPHSIEYRGPLTMPSVVEEAVLFPKETTQHHFSLGVGLAWPQFQIDAAYDYSQHYRVGSMSLVARF